MAGHDDLTQGHDCSFDSRGTGFVRHRIEGFGFARHALFDQRSPKGEDSRVPRADAALGPAIGLGDWLRSAASPNCTWLRSAHQLGLAATSGGAGSRRPNSFPDRGFPDRLEVGPQREERASWPGTAIPRPSAGVGFARLAFEAGPDWLRSACRECLRIGFARRTALRPGWLPLGDSLLMKPLARDTGAEIDPDWQGARRGTRRPFSLIIEGKDPAPNLPIRISRIT